MMTQSIMTVLWRVRTHQIISNTYKNFLILLVVINYLVGFRTGILYYYKIYNTGTILWLLKIQIK